MDDVELLLWNQLAEHAGQKRRQAWAETCAAHRDLYRDLVDKMQHLSESQPDPAGVVPVEGQTEAERAEAMENFREYVRRVGGFRV